MAVRLSKLKLREWSVLAATLSAPGTPSNLSPSALGAHLLALLLGFGVRVVDVLQDFGERMLKALGHRLTFWAILNVL